MSNQRSYTEKIETTGGQIVHKLKELFRDASAKRVVIRNAKGNQIMAFPLTFGVAGGVATLLWATPVAIIAAVGGVLAKLTLEVERTDDTPSDTGFHA
ncbi:DUF4342 domain-containing protein [Granulicoccus phenolivorans]|uniref:DUF4342 domain-containing protein n=1 Tax=Granulicoccus phenolivorans TaxID=266854 RepID=UPI000403D32E|nr:DUF4342 domain-containing protein [Granulicoccus phenolivorans]